MHSPAGFSFGLQFPPTKNVDNWDNKMQVCKACELWYFILTRFILLKYSCAFVVRYVLLPWPPDSLP